MKLKRRTKVFVACILLLCGTFLFFFYTSFGLLLQPHLAEPIHRAYLRFYTSRVAAIAGTDWGAHCKHLSAQKLYGLGMDDVLAAHDALSAGIAQRPDPADLQLRAYIELSMLSYSNAAADFEQSLRLWMNNPSASMDQSMISNHIGMAEACAEAKQKFWGQYFKNGQSR